MVADMDDEKKHDEEITLKPKMTLINGITVIVGSIIGSGIFVSPSGVLKNTGSVNVSLLVWTISGVFSMKKTKPSKLQLFWHGFNHIIRLFLFLESFQEKVLDASDEVILPKPFCWRLSLASFHPDLLDTITSISSNKALSSSQVGAYCYAELGTMIRKSGADYAYIMETFGPFMAFIRLWIECMIVRPCSQAIVALTFSQYVMKPLFVDCDPPDNAARLLAACCIFVLTFVNCYDVRWATRVQDVFTYAKLLALFIIIAAGIYQLYQGHYSNFSFINTKTEVTSLALSFYSGLFAYNVYVLTNIAFYTTLSPEEILESNAVAVTFANKLFGPFALSIPVFVALSTFGAVNGILLTSSRKIKCESLWLLKSFSRLFYAGACNGQMPELLTMIQAQRLTPAPSVLAMALLSMLYLTVSDIGALINYVGFATWLSIGVSVLCLPWLRWKRPDLERPIKVNLFWPISYILATIFVTVVPMIASPYETGMGVLMILSSVPVYFLCIAWTNKPVWFQSGLCFITVLIQKVLVVVDEASDRSVRTEEKDLDAH
ncbi:hypothetical protein HUJ04_002083 [Dendroctonus ponderosae]|nr:hypothetical protein HUJ04_002083 [Dendroctonus ponderosae]